MPLSATDLETIRQAGLALEGARPLAIKAKTVASAIVGVLARLDTGNAVVLRSQEADHLFPVGQGLAELQALLADFAGVATSIQTTAAQVQPLIDAVAALIPEPPEEEAPEDDA